MFQLAKYHQDQKRKVVRRKERESEIPKEKKKSVKFVEDRRLAEEKLKEYISNEITECYKSLDITGEGKLKEREIAAAYSTFGINLDKEEIREIINFFDIKDTGGIGFSDFYREMYESMSNTTSEEDLKLVFDVFDQDGDGFIGLDDTIFHFQKHGLLVDKNEAEECVDRIAKGGFGHISFTQFQKFCKEKEGTVFVEECDEED